MTHNRQFHLKCFWCSSVGSTICYVYIEWMEICYLNQVYLDIYLARGTPGIYTDWKEQSLRVALQRRTWGSWWMKNLTRASSVLLQVRKQMVSWAPSWEGWQAGTGRWLSLSILPLWGPIWSTVSRSRAPQYKKDRAVGEGPEEGHKDNQGGWSTSPMKTGWGSWACSVRGRDLIVAF